MRRALPLICVALTCAGCISTPSTKALITPIGAVGYHTFAPESQKGIDASDLDRMSAMIEESRTNDANK